MWEEIGEIVLWMVLAAVLGGVVGLLLAIGSVRFRRRPAVHTFPAVVARPTHGDAVAAREEDDRAARLAALETDVKGARAEAARLERELEPARLREEELAATIASLERQIRAAEETTGTRDATIAELESSIEVLREELARRDDRIAVLAQPVGPAAAATGTVSRRDGPPPPPPAPASLADTGDVEEIQGIGPAYGSRLRAAGAPTIRLLLERGSTEAGRKELAKAASIRPALILTWVNHADLMRVPGIDPQAAELLEAAGVDSPAELARRNPANLAERLARVNADKHLVPVTPPLPRVEGWVEAAARLSKDRG